MADGKHGGNLLQAVMRIKGLMRLPGYRYGTMNV